MATPIYDFITKYNKSGAARLHMPGHKGTASRLGAELFDITEIRGADSLFEASGIIAESEANATALFGSARTVYSAEGSTPCVKAMLAMAAFYSREPATQGAKGTKCPVIVAARNVHKSFIFGASFIDADVRWLYPPESEGLCSCVIKPAELDAYLEEMRKNGETPAAVYITSPDYLGNMSDISGLASVAHKYGTLLLVDNAHGAYLHFLDEPAHPLDLGADICCDSAHKTLPVLTGGAYLHVSKTAPAWLCDIMKSTLAMFSSTSPSYLIMTSLDLCNSYLEEKAKEEIADAVFKLKATKTELQKNGWNVKETDPLKLTVDISGVRNISEMLNGIEPEYIDPDWLVMMFTGKNKDEDFKAPIKALGIRAAFAARKDLASRNAFASGKAEQQGEICVSTGETPLCEEPHSSVKEIPELHPATPVLTIREAILSPKETISAENAAGRICASPSVSCPPAIPVVIPGELITAEAVEIMHYYGINTIDVIR